MQIGLDEAYALHQADMRSAKKKTWAAGIALVVLFILLARFGGGWFYSMKAPYQIGGLTIQLGITQMERLLTIALCGMMLAVAGNIFQCVFRNPMVAPTMLGVSSGVQIAVLFFVIRWGAQALNLPLLRYRYSYIGGILMLALVFAIGKYSSGRGKLNISDLLLVGISISTVVGSLASGYIIGMETTDQAVYMKVMNVGLTDTGLFSILCLVIAFFVCMVPMWLMRFSFNTLSYSAAESASFGVSAVRMRVMTLLCGTIMVTTAMMQCGGVGTAALVVPHLSRAIYGAESKKMFLGNAFLGAIVLLVCRQIADMLPWMNEEPFPLGYVVNIFAAPAFAFVMGFQKRGWE